LGPSLCISLNSECQSNIAKTAGWDRGYVSVLISSGFDRQTLI